MQSASYGDYVKALQDFPFPDVLLPEGQNELADDTISEEELTRQAAEESAEEDEDYM